MKDNDVGRGKLEENHMRPPLTLVGLISFCMTLAAAEPFVGTWKLNVEKSKLTGNSVDLAGEIIKDP